ncbi:NADH-quinone oxidoreductase subunit NuoG [Pinisolibacter aquiterrae]|uniref:NADH-quinone oxidoreductase subunit NuoG n=1 Tax=Pinisolibacter aquiterrae TaxID=2815579 RepID=UPI001C3D12A1|nr:NADH-quinone oxidoreductase subunit NuoG [Pinisolibacter aquiterrae]MBV5264457.1 NADH-quinone oxidoreductase subunit G [Pinisolibacter aquiterrae]MCC8234394.1 NADH-quinone oxidoreductase subunit NuoG [Pinisolibacter aquiterrae]
MAKIKIDGTEIDVAPEATLLQACEAAGAEVPRFCFHERLSVAGNCRMCLVEVKGGPPKPTASCAMAVKDLRPGPNGEPPEVFTTTPMVKRAREGVMEFLLINHPLDCPICDQGGECDLQDQAMAFGGDSSRFAENKRAVEDKDIGPLVKTVMTRCIQCTRCVRFTAEVAGTADMGLISRGEDVEITTYLETAMASELQGNIVDLCPVGALTSKPYEFKARPWELTKTESIDVMDALGSNIRVDARGREVVRILPRLNEDVNEEWISDKTRHVVDGLKTQRLDRPYVRDAHGKLAAASWPQALGVVAEKIKATAPEKIGIIVGDLASAEELFAIKTLAASLGIASIDARADGSRLGTGGRGSWLFNATIAGIDQADAILLVGTNPRKEAAVLNARIRKRWRKGGCPIGVLGEEADLTYAYNYLGEGPSSLDWLASGQNGFLDVLKNASKPLIIVGNGVTTRPDGAAVMAKVAEIGFAVGAVGPEWNHFSVLHTAANRVAALDLGVIPAAGGKSTNEILAACATGEIETLILIGADEIDTSNLGKTFVVYLGTHGDKGAHTASVILPGAAYTEKSGTWVNTEGRVQVGARAAFPVGEAREDWAILRALSALVGKTLPFDSLGGLRAAMVAAHPTFAGVDEIVPASHEDVAALTSGAGAMSGAGFVSPIGDFYLTNPIARASATMAECSALATARMRDAAE